MPLPIIIHSCPETQIPQLPGSLSIPGRVEKENRKERQKDRGTESKWNTIDMI